MLSRLGVLVNLQRHPLQVSRRSSSLVTLKPISAMAATRRSTRSQSLATQTTKAGPPAKVKTEAGQKTKETKARSKKSDQDRPVANTSRKRKREATEEKVKEEEDIAENHGAAPARSSAGKGKKAKKGPSEKDMQAGADMAKGFLKNRDAQRNEGDTDREERAKNNAYGLAPGVTPFPRYSHPTPDECQEVKDILAKAHGDISAPKTIPTPSLNSSGCGEVPSVLDALVRTRLSAATNNQNSSRAFRGLVQNFGLIKYGVGKGSVDWNRVRLAPQKEVFEAIKTGGLADVKSRDIKKILDLVHAENQERRANLEQDQKGSSADVEGEDGEERKREVEKANAEVLSLDHLHLLSSEDAFAKLIQYPGIGPKTASCVLLFCMQRPSFAVDTHVFRLTKWLGWVPTEQKAKAMAKAEAKETGEKVKSATVTREKTYAHLDVRIPDELKYPLHYLLIKHGKNCGWCSAKAGAAAKVGTCPLAHLMSGKGRNKGLAKKGGDIKEEDDDDEDDEDEEGDEEGSGEAEDNVKKEEDDDDSD